MNEGRPEAARQARAQRVVQRLRGGPHKLTDLARDFDVDRRTMRRDVEALLRVGHAVREHLGFWWIER